MKAVLFCGLFVLICRSASPETPSDWEKWVYYTEHSMSVLAAQHKQGEILNIGALNEAYAKAKDTGGLTQAQMSSLLNSGGPTNRAIEQRRNLWQQPRHVCMVYRGKRLAGFVGGRATPG